MYHSPAKKQNWKPQINFRFRFHMPCGKDDLNFQNHTLYKSAVYTLTKAEYTLMFLLVLQFWSIIPHKKKIKDKTN